MWMPENLSDTPVIIKDFYNISVPVIVADDKIKVQSYNDIRNGKHLHEFTKLSKIRLKKTRSKKKFRKQPQKYLPNWLVGMYYGWRFSFPLQRRIYPKFIAKELISVQPLTASIE